jgi:UDP-N-acetylmuramate dehydrogenase
MKILENYDLSKLNTFGVKAMTRFFIELQNESDIKELLISNIFKENERLFIGGGSNILFTKDFDGIVILNRLKGIEIVKEDNETVLIKSMGGEWWNDLVNFTVEHDLWGVENLSLVPGTVGATPVQNIGAYGVELKDVLENVEAYEIDTGDKKTFSNEECEFGYRESVFKNKFKGQYFISAIVLNLSKVEKSNTRYKALQEYLDENKIIVKNVRDISEAVSEIRMSKLPDPKILGNAGSFFKNVFVDKSRLEELKKQYPSIPSFEEADIVKIPAGWFIEQCGWKGKKVGNVGVHDKQALVLVNHGGATGEELKNLAEQIISDVFSKFGITLTKEVNLIP